VAPFHLSQQSHFFAINRLDGWTTLFESFNMNVSRSPVNICPLEVYSFIDPQPMAKHHQDEQRISDLVATDDLAALINRSTSSGRRYSRDLLQAAALRYRTSAFLVAVNFPFWGRCSTLEH
jgi:hypothetical protein